MELKLFTDLIDALGKVAGGLRTIGKLPKAEPTTFAPASRAASLRELIMYYLS
ncbi:MAG TPA: hypothetical protein VF173_01295 [Thermoanaerobaculia bacterium]|nr:hypothetical protein [Thermoanaerobaculia bacterium]